MELGDIKKIETKEQYEVVCMRLDDLIAKASEDGMLESEYDNEYTREIGYLSRLGAVYENEYMIFEHIKASEKKPHRIHNPIIKTKRKVFA